MADFLNFGFNEIKIYIQSAPELAEGPPNTRPGRVESEVPG